MKKMKKFLAVILSLSMILGMSITSFAAEGGNAGQDNKIGTSDDTATITVNGVDSATSVTAYPFIRATYGKNDNTTDFKGYEVLDAFESVDPAIEATTKADNTLEYKLTQSQISQIRSKLTGGSEKYTMNETQKDGEGTGTYTADVPIGAYLVVVEGSETSTYNAMVVSAYYKTKEVAGKTDNIIEMEKATATAKKSTEPSLDKKITGLNDDVNVNGTEKGNSVNLGDVLTYTVTIDNIPSYTGSYPVFNVADTLSSGLEYVSGSLTVKAGDTILAKDTDYTLTTPATENGNKLSLDFVVNDYAASKQDPKPENDYTLNTYAGKTLTLTYRVKVTNAALLNEAGNKNDVKLQFTKDSSVDSDDVKKEKEDQTYTYSFEIDGSIDGTYSEGGEDTITYISTKYILNKIGEEVAKEQKVNGTTSTYTKDLKQALSGAEFHLYTDENCTKEYTNAKDGSEKTAYGVITSDSEGQLKLTGLAAGTYYLKETKAPAGYTVNNTPVKIEISAEYYGEKTTIDAGESTITKNPGQLKSWSVKVNDQDVASFSISNEGDNIGKWTRTDTIVKNDPTTVYTKEGYDILNTKITELPSTGGIGTTIFTIAGCAIMVAAAGFFFMNRRKSAK